MYRYFQEKINFLQKSETFKKKPILVIFRCIIIFFALFLKIKFIYLAKLKHSKFFYTFKPYKKSGLGGRGQFIFRENYETFFNLGYQIFTKKFNFIDIGCSRGFFSMYLLKLKNLNSSGLCIDPLKDALNDFVEILKLNKVSKAKIIQGVVSNKKNKKVTLYRANDLNGYYSIIKNINFIDNKISKKFEVNSYTIDQLIFEKKLLRNIDFIKIDAEGAEYEILLKSIKTLKKFKPIIYCEIIRNNKKIFSLLNKYSYKFFKIYDQKLVHLKKNEIKGNILALQINSKFFKKIFNLERWPRG